MRMVAATICLFLATYITTTCAWAEVSKVKGSALVHTPQSAVSVIQHAAVALPASINGGNIFQGKWMDLPKITSAERVPVVVFLHGSSGLGLEAIGEWQLWLAGLGIASVAPDSFALPNRVTYTSPIGKDIYERLHALRASEIEIAVNAVKKVAWVDASRLVLAGTSEGATAVARYDGREFAARIVFSWSCEDNYFVETHGTRVIAEQPILNIISAVDPFFSPANPWLGNPAARGHCAAAFSESKQAAVVVIPGALHTLINLPQVRAVTRSFLEDVLKH